MISIRIKLNTVVLILVMLTGCLGIDFKERTWDESVLNAGISKALAESRAGSIDEVRYALSMSLERNTSSATGTIQIRFKLKEPVDRLVLDYFGDQLFELEVNGCLVEEPARAANHIVIDGIRLKQGANTIAARFAAPVGEGGTALTRYSDRNDGSEYYYTLLVPGDAHTLFPCFDQPDLKARVDLTLEVPTDWIAVANAPLLPERTSTPEDGRILYSFASTAPVSTYLVAFAAGPFVRLESEYENQTIGCYVRPARLDAVDAQALFRLHMESLNWLKNFFGFPYPFKKFDFVLVPDFPYGGMEHVGAIFYRESLLAFDSTPTAAQLFKRSVLIYHEVAHQWFGDLVTMRWFDDVWLKEGFATFLSFKILEDLEPAKQAWKRFSQRVEPKAYLVESTRGTTPVYQELDNLADAKSTYGAIVYNKAPAMLRQLEFLLGDDVFQKAAQIFVLRHAYGNATWRDLIRCCEEAARIDLDEWSRAWLLTKGMPKVTVKPRRSPAGFVEGIQLTQRGVHDEDAFWPFKTRLALGYEGGDIEEIDLNVRAARIDVDMPLKGKAPLFIFANAGDYAYGRFPLDAESLENLVDGVHEIKDPFLKSLLLDAMWDMVRAAELAPARYVETALQAVTGQADPMDCTALLANIGVAFKHYLSPVQVAEWSPRVEAKLQLIIEDEALAPALRHTCYKAFIGLASTPEGLDRLAGILTEDRLPSGMPQSPRDRWELIQRLIVTGHPEAGVLFKAEAESDQSVDAAKYRFVAGSAFPDAAVKSEYFSHYLEETKFPEAWLEASLDGFNAPGQSELTLPYLTKALEMAEWTKEHRKIFFLPRWLDSFIRSHDTKGALEEVDRFLDARRDLSKDIVLKILQSADPLARKLEIRARYAGEDA